MQSGKRLGARVQAKYEAAEVRVRQTQEALTQQEAEAVKLEQRLAAAREQYDSGLAKLRSTARQLESLSSQARTAYYGHFSPRLLQSACHCAPAGEAGLPAAHCLS